MVQAFRRILWVVPVLAAGTVALFAAIGSTSAAKQRMSGPLFYEPHPQSAQIAADRAIVLISAGDPEGAPLLQRLGGAALPRVLDRMSTLTVKNRRLVAEALQPLAARMRLTEPTPFLPRPALAQESLLGAQEQSASDEQLLFWERYRDERGLDLRPLPASRLVKRIAQRDAQLRSSDLLAIDTFALPALIGALGRIRSERDVARCRRLVAIIAHTTGKNWSIAPNATVGEARRVTTSVRRFWDSEGAQWSQLDRLGLFVARGSQTEWMRWVYRSTRQLTGLDEPILWDQLKRRGNSLALIVCCLFGLLVVGPVAAAVIQVTALRGKRFHLERISLRAGLGFLMTCGMWALLSQKGGSPERLYATAFFFGTLFSCFTLHRDINDRLDWRTHHVLRSRGRVERVSAIARWTLPTIPTLTPLVVTEAAIWVTCLELGAGSEGLGSASIAALRSGDIDLLMAVCVALGLGTIASQAIADALLVPLGDQPGGA